jgi:hypothetical protein
LAVLIFLLGFFLFWGSDSFAQMYKYVDKEGKICFTDNLTSSLLKEGISSNKDKKPAEGINPKKRSGAEIKDIMQLGQDILEEELAKPPEKQNRHLVQEMREILYGDVTSKKPKNTPN